MARLDRHPTQTRDSQTQEDPVPTGEPGSGDRALKNPELVAQGEILEGDGHRPEQQGAEERPETEHEEHGPPRHQT
jgi:hypothetical protein